MCERPHCPLITLEVAIIRSKTKVDFQRLLKWLAPGVSVETSRQPEFGEMSTFKLWIPLEPSQHAKDFVERYHKMTQSVTHGAKFRME